MLKILCLKNYEVPFGMDRADILQSIEEEGKPCAVYFERQKAAFVDVFRRVQYAALCRPSPAQISRNIFLIGLGCALAACAGGSDVTPEATPRVEVELKTDGVTAETFTTVGKPTKTIETPWGPREIYDPAQDSDVRKVFGDYIQSEKQYTLSPNGLFLRRATRLTVDLYRETGCSKVIDGQCLIHSFPGCEGPNTPPNCVNLPPVKGAGSECAFPDHIHDSKDYKAMTDLDKAMFKYFEIECLNWKQEE